MTACCPTETQNGFDLYRIPDAGSDHAEEAFETHLPTVNECHESQENIKQKSCPYLPGDGVLVVTKEVAQLKCLLDLLEEHFDRPAALVEFADGTGRPFHVVCHERHFAHFAVDFDQRMDYAHLPEVLVFGNTPRQGDYFVAKDIAPARDLKLSNTSKRQVLLWSCHPKDLALAQIGKKSEVNVCLVE